MANNDLRSLPKVRDSWSYLYADRCRIEVDDKSIAILDMQGKTPVPCSSLSLLLLGPGSTITHAAIRALADNGCMVAWTGEEGVRMYAFGTGETRSAANLHRQIRRWADKDQRLQVVRALYALRFPKDAITPHTSLKQLRGMEGARMRHTYAEMSRATGVPWTGRTVGKGDWERADPVNRALSSANAALYGICHAAIVALGYSPAIGFIHTGKQLSFVYDIADLYKTQVSIPAAFATVAMNAANAESQARMFCRDAFREHKILERIVTDIDAVIGSPQDLDPFAEDATLPGGLWDPETGVVEGGVNYAADVEFRGSEAMESWISLPSPPKVEDDWDPNEVVW
ncbi:MAG: type I-E CRISPR-associated endonuclease Cas1 [Thermomicrobiales bacterium]|nr:type I-E CRISPR-associated endonuclease Cas1 [Thermomicrobiales bacterium]